MGDKERGEMLVDLDHTVTELKELTYKLSKHADAYGKAAFFLKNDPSQLNPTNLPDTTRVVEDLNHWKELQENKIRLEKALSRKVTIE